MSALCPSQVKPDKIPRKSQLFLMHFPDGNLVGFSQVFAGFQHSEEVLYEQPPSGIFPTPQFILKREPEESLGPPVFLELNSLDQFLKTRRSFLLNQAGRSCPVKPCTPCCPVVHEHTRGPEHRSFGVGPEHRSKRSWTAHEKVCEIGPKAARVQAPSDDVLQRWDRKKVFWGHRMTKIPDEPWDWKICCFPDRPRTFSQLISQ